MIQQPSEEDVALAIKRALLGDRAELSKEGPWREHELKPARAILALFAPILAEKERDITTLAQRLAHAYEAKHRCNEDANYERARALAAEAAVLAVAPYVDSIVCYASTVSEHDGNRVAKLVNEAAAAIRAQGE